MELHLEDGEVWLAGRPVLRNIAVELRPGCVTGLVGPNGSGKSTLLRTLAGILPLRRGRALLGDRSLARLTRRDLARQIAYVPQSTEIPFQFTVKEVVSMGRYPHLRRFREEGREGERAVDRALRAADLEGLRQRSVTHLSGGERQRVLVARALATEAPILLLDEPVASLDIRHALDLLALLRRQAATGRSVLVALHDLNLAARFCERLVLLRAGRIEADGAPDQVLDPEHVGRVFHVQVRRVPCREVSQLVFERSTPDG